MIVCKKCKSTEVSYGGWVWANDFKMPPLDQCDATEMFCSNCDDYTELVEADDGMPEDMSWSEAIDYALAPLVDKLKRMDTQVKSHVNGFSVIQRSMVIYEDATLGGAVEFVKNMKEGNGSK